MAANSDLVATVGLAAELPFIPPNSLDNLFFSGACIQLPGASVL